MDTITKHLRQVEEGMTLLDRDEIEQVIKVLKLARAEKGTVYVMGNGGSAATASHFVNDLIKIAKVKAVCVSDMVPTMLAYGNDTGWENMWAGTLRGLGLERFDVVFGISCSGRSANVIKALEAGNEVDAMTVGMTGMSNDVEINQAARYAVIHARVPDIRVQEDLHMMVCHAMVRAIQEEGNV